MYMKSKNIADKIKCAYQEKCIHYCPWHGGDICSWCTSCRNNMYNKKEKKSYYKQSIGETIFEIIVIGVVVGVGILLVLKTR